VRGFTCIGTGACRISTEALRKAGGNEGWPTGLARGSERSAITGEGFSEAASLGVVACDVAVKRWALAAPVTRIAAVARTMLHFMIAFRLNLMTSQRAALYRVPTTTSVIRVQGCVALLISR
jgi:hypothetical protein